MAAMAEPQMLSLPLSQNHLKAPCSGPQAPKGLLENHQAKWSSLALKRSSNPPRYPGNTNRAFRADSSQGHPQGEGENKTTGILTLRAPPIILAGREGSPHPGPFKSQTGSVERAGRGPLHEPPV